MESQTDYIPHQRKADADLPSFSFHTSAADIDEADNTAASVDFLTVSESYDQLSDVVLENFSSTLPLTFTTDPMVAASSAPKPAAVHCSPAPPRVVQILEPSQTNISIACSASSTNSTNIVRLQCSDLQTQNPPKASLQNEIHSKPCVGGSLNSNSLSSQAFLLTDSVGIEPGAILPNIVLGNVSSVSSQQGIFLTLPQSVITANDSSQFIIGRAFQPTPANNVVYNSNPENTPHIIFPSSLTVSEQAVLLGEENGKANSLPSAQNVFMSSCGNNSSVSSSIVLPIRTLSAGNQENFPAETSFIINNNNELQYLSSGVMGIYPADQNNASHEGDIAPQEEANGTGVNQSSANKTNNISCNVAPCISVTELSGQIVVLPDVDSKSLLIQPSASSTVKDSKVCRDPTSKQNSVTSDAELGSNLAVVASTASSTSGNVSSAIILQGHLTSSSFNRSSSELSSPTYTQLSIVGQTSDSNRTVANSVRELKFPDSSYIVNDSKKLEKCCPLESKQIITEHSAVSSSVMPEYSNAGDVGFELTSSIKSEIHQYSNNHETVLVADETGQLIQVVISNDLNNSVDVASSPIEISLGKQDKVPTKTQTSNISYASPGKEHSLSGPYHCMKCSTVVRSSYAKFRRHLEQHLQDKPHCCADCNESFNYSSNLTLHMIVHIVNSFQCPECDKKFRRLASLKSHLSVHMRDESVQCAFCGEEFVSILQLPYHQHTVHGSFDLTDCTRTFYPEIKNELCDDGFSVQNVSIESNEELDSLSALLKNVGDDNRELLRYLILNKKVDKVGDHLITFQVDKNVGEHVVKKALDEMDEEKETVPCVGARLSDPEQYVVPSSCHRKDSFAESTKLYNCIRCSARLPTLKQLELHVAKHRKMKQLVTSKSRRRYSWMSSNAAHSGRSSGPRRNRGRHYMYEHSCQFCSKCFHKPSQLLRHTRIHTGEKPFKCSYPGCERAFNQKSTLLSHKSIHTGLKPFSCELCGKKFAQKSNLVCHSRRVHPVDPPAEGGSYHQCEECCCVFKNRGSLNAHISQAHSVPVESSGGLDRIILFPELNVTSSGGSKVTVTLTSTSVSNTEREKCNKDANSINIEENMDIGTAIECVATDDCISSPDAKAHCELSHFFQNNSIIKTEPVDSLPTDTKSVQNRSVAITNKLTADSLESIRRLTSLNLNNNEKSLCKPRIISVRKEEFLAKLYEKRKENAALASSGACNIQTSEQSNLRCARSERHDGKFNSINSLSSGDNVKSECDVSVSKKLIDDSQALGFSHRSSGILNKTQKQSFDSDDILQKALKNSGVSSDKIELENSLCNAVTCHYEPSEKEVIKTVQLQNAGCKKTTSLTNSNLPNLCPDSNGTKELFSEQSNSALLETCEDINESIANSSLHYKDNPVQSLGSFCDDAKVKCRSTAPELCQEDSLRIQIDSKNGMFLNKEACSETDFILSSVPISHNDAFGPRSTSEGETGNLCKSETSSVSFKQYKRIMLTDKVGDIVRKHQVFMRWSSKNIRFYMCVYGNCCKEFRKPSDLLRHLRCHTEDKPYKCNKCYRSFRVKSTLVSHLKTHAFPSSETDDNCNSFKSEISKDPCWIPDDSVLQSPSCVKSGANIGDGAVRGGLNESSLTFQCYFCSEVFDTASSRRSHLHDTHKSLQNTQEVNKTSMYPEANRIKVKVASRKRQRIIPSHRHNTPMPAIPLQEPILLTENGPVKQLARNSAVYSSEGPEAGRPHKCRYCPAALKKSSHLKQHERIHTGERPYVCHLCRKDFNSHSVLKTHMRTHMSASYLNDSSLGFKRECCPHCQKYFAASNSLKRHLQCAHSNKRPYMCPYCQKTFKTNCACKKHMTTHVHELSMRAVHEAGEVLHLDQQKAATLGAVLFRNKVGTDSDTSILCADTSCVSDVPSTGTYTTKNKRENVSEHFMEKTVVNISHQETNCFESNVKEIIVLPDSSLHCSSNSAPFVTGDIFSEKTNFETHLPLRAENNKNLGTNSHKEENVTANHNFVGSSEHNSYCNDSLKSNEVVVVKDNIQPTDVLLSKLQQKLVPSFCTNECLFPQKNSVFSNDKASDINDVKQTYTVFLNTNDALRKTTVGTPDVPNNVFVPSKAENAGSKKMFRLSKLTPAKDSTNEINCSELQSAHRDASRSIESPVRFISGKFSDHGPVYTVSASSVEETRQAISVSNSACGSDVMVVGAADNIPTFVLQLPEDIDLSSKTHEQLLELINSQQIVIDASEPSITSGRLVSDVADEVNYDVERPFLINSYSLGNLETSVLKNNQDKDATSNSVATEGNDMAPDRDVPQKSYLGQFETFIDRSDDLYQPYKKTIKRRNSSNRGHAKSHSSYKRNSTFSCDRCDASTMRSLSELKKHKAQYCIYSSSGGDGNSGKLAETDDLHVGMNGSNGKFLINQLQSRQMPSEMLKNESVDTSFRCADQCSYSTDENKNSKLKIFKEVLNQDLISDVLNKDHSTNLCNRNEALHSVEVISCAAMSQSTDDKLLSVAHNQKSSNLSKMLPEKASPRISGENYADSLQRTTTGDARAVDTVRNYTGTQSRRKQLDRKKRRGFNSCTSVCIVCKRNFSGKSELSEHLQSQHPGHHCCTVCWCVFTSEETLRQHSASTHNQWVCPICNELQFSLAGMQAHLRVHPKAIVQNALAGPYSAVTASDPPEEDFNNDVLESPRKQSSKPLIASTETNCCQYCSKTFKKPSDLVRHIRTHTGEKPFACHLCSKSFAVKSTLDAHLRSHRGDKQFQCKVCHGCFASKGSYNIHMRIHTGSKPLQCPYCPLKFRTSGHRKVHVLSHFKACKTALVHKTVTVKEDQLLPSEDTLGERNIAIDDEVSRISRTQVKKVKKLNGDSSASVLCLDSEKISRNGCQKEDNVMDCKTFDNDVQSRSLQTAIIIDLSKILISDADVNSVLPDLTTASDNNVCLNVNMENVNKGKEAQSSLSASDSTNITAIDKIQVVNPEQSLSLIMQLPDGSHYINSLCLEQHPHWLRSSEDNLTTSMFSGEGSEMITDDIVISGDGLVEEGEAEVLSAAINPNVMISASQSDEEEEVSIENRQSLLNRRATCMDRQLLTSTDNSALGLPETEDVLVEAANRENKKSTANIFLDAEMSSPNLCSGATRSNIILKRRL